MSSELQEVSYADVHALIEHARLDEASGWLERIEGAVGRTVESEVLRALIVRAEGDLTGALALLQSAATTYPASTLAQFEYGRAALDLERFDEAAAACNAGIVSDPSHVGCHVLLALGFQRSGRPVQSLQAARQVLALDEQNVNALQLVAEAQTSLGLHADSASSYKKLLALCPARHDIRSAFLLQSLYADTSRESVERRHAEHGAFWSQTERTPVQPRQAQDQRSKHGDGRLTIGYVSPNLHSHSVAYFLLSILLNHDRKRFRLIAYTNARVVDGMTQVLKSLFDEWRVVAPLSDVQTAAQIRADGVDVLVDLAGHTGSNLLSVFALKPAPVQVSYLGYAASTGLASIDARIGDTFTDPPGAVSANRVIRLERCFLAYTPSVQPDVTSVRGRPAPSRPLRFGSFNNTAKYSELSLDLWAATMAAVPAAELHLKHLNFNDAALGQVVRQRFELRGIDPARIHTFGYSPTHAAHLESYKEIDIALDCAPYNGTTTTVEASLMGVPTVTLVGQSHAARVSGSILNAMDLAELCATTPEQFVAIAQTLAEDQGSRADMASTLRTRLMGSDLGDGVSLTRALENALEELAAAIR